MLLAWLSTTSLCSYDSSNFYAPVASHDSIRLILSIAASEYVIIEGADESSANIYGDVDIPMVMQQPTDSSSREAKAGYVCQLKKSIY